MQSMRPVPVAGKVTDEAARCPYCGNRLQDMGAGFSDHILARPGCQQAHEEWMARLDEDRASGG